MRRPIALSATPASRTFLDESPEAHLGRGAERAQFGGAPPPQAGVVLPAKPASDSSCVASVDCASSHLLIVAHQLPEAS